MIQRTSLSSTLRKHQVCWTHRDEEAAGRLERTPEEAAYLLRREQRFEVFREIRRHALIMDSLFPMGA